MNKQQETKNCHYVQQAYLKNFASNTKKTRIWQFDKTNGEAKERLIKKVAKQNYFYEQAVENWMSANVEVTGIKAIRKLIRFSNLDVLSEVERESIARWVIIQNERTRLRRIDYENSSEMLLEKLKKMGHLPTDLKDCDIDAEETQYAVMSNMMKLIPNLLNYHWVLLENNTSIKFLTTDQVVIMDNSLTRTFTKKIGFNPFTGSLGYLSDGIEFHIPLNPHLMLVMINTHIKAIPIMINNKIQWKEVSPVMQNFQDRYLRESYSNKMILTKENVIIRNHQLIYNACRYIFAQDDDFDSAREIIKTQPECRDERRPRMKII